MIDWIIAIMLWQAGKALEKTEKLETPIQVPEESIARPSFLYEGETLEDLA